MQQRSMSAPPKTKRFIRKKKSCSMKRKRNLSPHLQTRRPANLRCYLRKTQPHRYRISSVSTPRGTSLREAVNRADVAAITLFLKLPRSNAQCPADSFERVAPTGHREIPTPVRPLNTAVEKSV